MNTTATPPLTPVSLGERIFTLDVLRGFALLGILTVNMGLFAGPIYPALAGIRIWEAPWDRAATFLINLLATGKFYSLFSFLFGYGFSVQLLRAKERGIPLGPVYARRLTVLLVIGLIHAFLIWFGDILVIYAIFGFALLAFHLLKNDRSLLIWAAILILIPVALTGLGWGAIEMGRAFAPDKIAESFTAQDAGFRKLMDDSFRIYPHGSYWEITRQRAADVLNLYSFAPFWVSPILGMFLVGLWAGRKRIFQRLQGIGATDLEREELRNHIRKVQRRCLWLGIAGNLIYAWSTEGSAPTIPNFQTFLGAIGFSFGAPALCFFYAATLIRLTWDDAWHTRLQPIAALGRMALTNYLMQSLVCTLLFYSYGLGYYGKLGPALGLALTLALYLAQIPVSVWWLRSHTMGPMEWLWRKLTYGVLPRATG